MVWLHFYIPCTHLNLALLLHKQGLVATGVATTEQLEIKILFYTVFCKRQIFVELLFSYNAAVMTREMSSAQLTKRELI